MYYPFQYNNNIQHIQMKLKIEIITYYKNGKEEALTTFQRKGNKEKIEKILTIACERDEELKQLITKISTNINFNNK